MDRGRIVRNKLSQSILGDLPSCMLLTIFYVLNPNKTRCCCLTVVMRSPSTSLQCSDFSPREILIAPVLRIHLYISSTSHIDVLGYLFHVYTSLTTFIVFDYAVLFKWSLHPQSLASQYTGHFQNLMQAIIFYPRHGTVK